VRAFRGADVSTEQELRWLWLACHAAGLVWDYESMDLLSARQLALARAVGALTALPTALGTRAGVHLFAGDFADAASLAAEAALVTEAIGSSIAPFGALGLAAFRGRPAAAVELLKAVNADEQHPAEGIGLTFVQWATAVLCNGLGRYEQALAAAHQASADSPARRFTGRALSEVVEAATRTGAPEHAADALRRLAESTGASGTDWGLGVEARSRALVSKGETAEALYREAIDRLGRARLRMERGRALVYGEWLRRQRRIRDARDQLRRAYELFTEVGMEAFADRARLELRAAGVRTAHPKPGCMTPLPPKRRLSPASRGQVRQTRRSREAPTRPRATCRSTSFRRGQLRQDQQGQPGGRSPSGQRDRSRGPPYVMGGSRSGRLRTPYRYQRVSSSCPPRARSGGSPKFPPVTRGQPAGPRDLG
jgi:tetratricopeptide (TPR) repeat protein